LKFSRFGAVVSGKVSKSAVARNKIKRIIFDFIRLREVYRQPGRDFLIITSPRVNRATKEEIEKQLEQILL
jgi:ribonuclease P protein component